MKKTFKLFAAVVAVLVCTISCELNSIELQNAVSEGNTFTATIGQKAPAATPASKVTVDDAGKCAWSEGDKIIVYNGNTADQIVISQAANFADYVEVITITADMLSNDKKTVSFSTSLAAPASGKKWHFYATNNLSNVYCIWGDNANMIGGSVSATDNYTVPFVATASASAVGESLSFKHALGYLKMHGSAWLYKVAVRSNGYDDSANPNNDAIVQSYNVIASDGSVTGRNDKKGNDYVCTVNDVGVGKDFYVALAPAHTWASGITIDAFYGAERGSYNWGFDSNPRTPATSQVINAPFSVKAGQIIDLGDILADHSKKSTYYEMWEAGQDITFDGVKYNKSTAGLSAVHVTENTTVENGVSNKIYFVDEGDTLTIAGECYLNNMSFIGNTAGKKSAVVFKGTKNSRIGSGNGNVMFKNLIVNTSALANQGPLWVGAGSALNSVVFDDCDIDFNKKVITPGDGSIAKVAVVNCNWKVANGAAGNEVSVLANGTVDKDPVIGTFKFQNNIVYTAGSASIRLVNFDGNRILDKVIVKNNSFINIKAYSGWGSGLVYVNTIKSSIVVEGNLFHCQNAESGNISIVSAAGMTDEAYKAILTHNVKNYQYNTGLLVGSAVGQISWEPTWSAGALFTAIDFDTMTFTKASGLETFGATR